MPTTKTTTTRTKTTRRRARKRGRRKARARAGNFNQNLSSMSMWFKTAGDITANPSNNTIYSNTNANNVFPVPSFVNVCRNWEQYKVVKVIVKYYPAYVGSETSTAVDNGYRRGNVITFIDQPPLAQQPQAGSIANLMGFPSAKLHQTRSTIKRWMNRPSGGRTADWSYISHPTALGVPNVQPDFWESEIICFGDNFSTSATSNKAYFFVERLFKVVFRSRWRGGPQ